MNKKASGIIQNAAAQAGNNGRRIRFLDPSLSEIRERGIELAATAPIRTVVALSETAALHPVPRR